MKNSDKVRRLALWGIPLSLMVMGLKMLAWYVTGSVALLSDGLESTVNVIAAVIAWAVVGVPILWGVWITLEKTAALFKG